MRKNIIFLLFFCFLTLPGFSQESITITTYYPSPAGVYNELYVHDRMAIGDVNNDGQLNTQDLAVDAAANLLNGTLTIANSLGIGTTTPAGELHVRSTDTGNGNANLVLEGESPANGASTGFWGITAQGGAPTVAPAGNLQFNSTNSAGVTTTPITFSQGAANNSIFVAPNSNVGIGTNNPQARLDINGEARIGISTPALACTAGTAGAIRYNSGKMEYCDGSTSQWKPIGQAIKTVVTLKRFENATTPNLSIVSYVGDDPGPIGNIASVVEGTCPPPWQTHGAFGIKCKSENGWALSGLARMGGNADIDSFMYDNAGWGDKQDGQNNTNVVYVNCIKMQ
ncbi:MAG: hypothetical protein WC546_06605 [Candidatus Omnitrophota bacterium]